MKHIDWNSVDEAQEFEKPEVGGYICAIRSAVDFPDKEYLKIEFDITEGKYKGYYSGLFKARNFWGGSFIKSYKENAQPFFKGFLTSVEKSNPGYKFDDDENKLVRKYIGLVLAEEEYEAKDGTIKTRLYVAQERSIETIKKGDFEVPSLKKLSKKNNNSSPGNIDFMSGGNIDGFIPVNEDDLPF